MWRRLRKAIFWLHLATGITAGLVVLVMAATGVLLTYQRQVQTWADTRGLAAAPLHDGAVMLPPESLLDSAAAHVEGIRTSIRWQRDPAAPVAVAYGRDRTLYLNGYTGAVLGEGSSRMRTFFRGVTDLHRWLALTGDNQARGRAITGASNLAFLLIVLAGLLLWWPRNLTRRAFRSVAWFRRGLGGKARDFNWHNVVGVWSLVPLLAIITSAIVISYGWAGAIVSDVAGEDTPQAVAAPSPTPLSGDVRGSTGAARISGVAAAGNGTADVGAAFLLERARAQLPDWRTVTLHLPLREDRARFTLDSGTGGQPQDIAEVTLSGTGVVQSWQPFSSGSRAERVRSILRYAHTGEVLGIAGQTLAGLASAGAVLLVVTGFALALRRLAAWRGRRRRGRPVPPTVTAVR